MLAERTSNISSALVSSYSWDEIVEEIQKCDLICANCHRVEHWVLGEQYDGVKELPKGE